MAPFCVLKLILIGESGVGKTSVLRRFTDGIFHDALQRPTVIDLKEQAIQVYGKSITLMIWDTAGQERFKAMTREYYRNSDGIILMYDVTHLESYYKVSSWLSHVRQHCDGITIIVGNKNEDPASKRVHTTVIEGYATQEGLEFIEISAKTGRNVEEVFRILVRKILEKKYPTLFGSSTTTGSPASSNVTGTSDPKVTLDETEVTANNDDDVIRLSDELPVPKKRRWWHCLIL